MTQIANDLVVSWVNGANFEPDPLDIFVTWEVLLAADGTLFNETMLAAYGYFTKERINVKPIFRLSVETTVQLLQALSMSPLVTTAFPLAAADSITLTSSSSSTYSRVFLLAEILRVSEKVSGVREQTIGLDEGLGLAALLDERLVLSAGEFLNLTANQTYKLLAQFAEQLRHTDTARAQMELVVQLRHSLSLVDSIGSVSGLSAVELLTLTPSLEQEIVNYLKAVEQLGLTGLSPATTELYGRLGEHWLLYDIVGLMRLFGITENVLLASAIATQQQVKVNESLGLLELARVACELGALLKETYSTSDLSLVLTKLGVTESMTFVDLPEVLLGLLVRDPVAFTQQVFALQEVSKGLSEAVVLRSPADLRVVFGLLEEVTLAESAAFDLLQVLFARESFVLNPAVAVLQEASRRASERVRLTDRLFPGLSQTLSESISLLSSLTMLRGLSIRETLTLQESPAVNLIVSFQEALAFADGAGEIFRLSAAEELELREALLNSMVLPLVEALTLDPQSSGSLFTLLASKEILQVSSLTRSTLELLLKASTALMFIEQLPSAPEFSAWVFNSDTLAPTQYTNFPMNSFMELGNQLYGVASDGIYLLEGASDAGASIDTLVCTGDLNFGALGQKSIPRAYLLITKPGDILLKTHTYHHGQQKEHFYKVVLRQEDDMGLVRVPLRRELRSEFWAFELQNVEGGDFELQGAEVLPALLSRRV